MARSEILSLLCDVIPISDVSGLAFDLPRRRVRSSGPARLQNECAATRRSGWSANLPLPDYFMVARYLGAGLRPLGVAPTVS